MRLSAGSIANVHEAPRQEVEVPDLPYYRPFFSPWLGYGDFKEAFLRVKPFTLVTADRCYMIASLLRQCLRLPGEVWECGVYRGGTAMLMAKLMEDVGSTDRALRLFDTFAGMPDTDQSDWHKGGDFKDTSLEAIKSQVTQSFANFHPGVMPDSFKGLDSAQIAFAHIDVDIYRSVVDCSDFIYPRVSAGGVIVYDDYGFISCPGARKAVDTFYEHKPEVPLVMPTGQALVFKLPS